MIPNNFIMIVEEKLEISIGSIMTHKMQHKITHKMPYNFARNSGPTSCA